jgi:4-amino-4-deoxy-L-arabinose transferase-like glycosyltransferase
MEKANSLEHQGKGPNFASLSFFLLSLLLISLVLFIGFYNLGGYLMDDDEGTYLYAAWRISLGEIPYRDFFISQTPLSFGLTAVLFRLFGPSVWWARAACYLLILGAGFLIYWVSKTSLNFNRHLSLAIAAVFLLTKNIHFLGRTFMPDCHMLFWCTAALFFALKSESLLSFEKQKLPLFLFGLFTGLATLSKFNGILLFVGYLVFLFYLLAKKMDEPPQVFKKALVSSSGFLLSFGLVFILLLIFVPGTYYCNLGYHLAKGKTEVTSFAVLPFVRLVQFVGNHNYGLIPVALIGLIFSPIFKERKRILLLFITLAFLFLIFIPGDFYLRYLAFALVPLSFFFGEGMRFINSRKRLRPYAIPVALILVLLSLAPTFNPRKLGAYDKGTRALASYVRDNTAAPDYVFGDEPGINFYARRPCPPRLVDVSRAMTESGQITSADIESQCERYRVKLILIERGKSAHHLKNLKDWPLFQAYLGRRYRFVETVQREFLQVDIYCRNSP